MLLVERRLEWEQCQHSIRGGGHMLDPPLAPSPDRGADIVDGAYATGPHALLQAQVEVRRVDADHQIRLARDDLPQQLCAQFEQPGQVAQHFADAHHRQHINALQCLAAGRLHQRAGDAEKARIRQALFQRLDQRGAEHVTGGFAGHDGDQRAGLLVAAHRQPRCSGRRPASMNFSIRATSSEPAAIAASSCLTSSSTLPER